MSIKKREKSNSFPKTDITPGTIDEMIKNFQQVDTNIVVKSYCSHIFSYVRRMDGVKDSEIIKSLDPTNNRYQIFKTN